MLMVINFKREIVCVLKLVNIFKFYFVYIILDLILFFVMRNFILFLWILKLNLRFFC